MTAPILVAHTASKKICVSQFIHSTHTSLSAFSATGFLLCSLRRRLSQFIFSSGCRSGRSLFAGGLRPGARTMFLASFPKLERHSGTLVLPLLVLRLFAQASAMFSAAPASPLITTANETCSAASECDPHDWQRAAARSRRDGRAAPCRAPGLRNGLD